MEHDLRKALSKRVRDYYQPLVNLQLSRLRLRGPNPMESSARGMISPVDFIAFAEETALIVPIGEWVLRRACKEQGMAERHLRRGQLFPRSIQVAQI